MHMKEIHDPLVKEELKKTAGAQAADRNGKLYTKSEADGAANRHERRAAEAKARHNTKQFRSKLFG